MAKRLRLPEVVDLLEKAYGKPRTAEHPEAPLLDHLLVGVLTAWGDREKAGRALRALSESFLDLNEARVSPIAELTAVLHPFLGAKADGDRNRGPARLAGVGHEALDQAAEAVGIGRHDHRAIGQLQVDRLTEPAASYADVGEQDRQIHGLGVPMPVGIPQAQQHRLHLVD